MANTTETTLWKLLEKQKIVIPSIQRDYAQGRTDEGKDELRNRFLKSLKDSFSSSKPAIKLDFVYGSVEKEDMVPLDGQQRLTTLWLLHWYIAFRAGKLKNDGEVSKRLLKFTYATRRTSKQFCSFLVTKFQDVEPSDVPNVVEYIKKQNWYYRTYQYDPTIRAVLIMLGGDRSAEKYPHMNGIEQFFPIGEDFSVYWDHLTEDRCPIRFIHKDMQDGNMPLTDDLYVKMNARGKQLTHFENFKAELVGYTYPDIEGTEEKKKFFDIENNEEDLSFISNLDNDWIRLFWPYKHKTYNRVDEIYYKFLRQYMEDYYLCTASVANEIEKTELFQTLQSNRFSSIEDYSIILTQDFKNRIFKTLNGLVKYEELLNKNLGHDDDINKHLKNLSGYFNYDFLPTYLSSENETIENLQVQNLQHLPHVMFFSICKFFENNHFDSLELIDTSLKSWLRFCNNICYNPRVDGPASRCAAIRILSEISDKDYSNNIYEKLALEEKLPVFNSTAASEQIEEEWYKAHIQQDHNEIGAEFEDAEKYAFFSGSIRFLLWDENGNYSSSIDNFHEKYAKSKLYFPESDTNNYSLDSRIIENSTPFQNYFNSCHSIYNVCSDNNEGDRVLRFDGHGYSWKAMLNNRSLQKTTHVFLTNDPLSSESLRAQEQRVPYLKERTITEVGEQDPVTIQNLERFDFLTELVFENDFLKHLNTNPIQVTDGILFLRGWHEWKLCPLRASAERKVIVVGTSRNRILSDLISRGILYAEQNIQGSTINWGWNIPFLFKEYSFNWKYNSFIELIIDGQIQLSQHIGFNSDATKLISVLNEMIIEFERQKLDSASHS